MDRPINLTVKEGLLGPDASFGERIRANYEIMTATFSSEELLFLLVNPPETPYPESDVFHIAMGDVRKDTQNILFSVVNNIINRILLEDRSALSYQDTVYLDMALRKFGVQNVASFMEQVRVLRAENLSVHRLTALYGDNLHTLRETLTRETEARGGPVKTAEAEGEARGKERSLYLHSEILKRLDTPGIVRTLARFARASSENRLRVDAREMQISEHRRAAMVFALNEYRSEIPAFGAGDVYYNRNHYETGDVLKAPQDEKSVLRQALSAALLQVADNVTTSRAQDPPAERAPWLDVTEALRASARNSVERLLSFRAYAVAAAAENAAARREPADLQTLALLSRSEAEVLTRCLSEIHRHDAHRGAADGEGSADTAFPPRAARAADEAARSAREIARETLLELARIYSARLRASETLTRRARERVTEEVRADAAFWDGSATLARPAEAQARTEADAVPLTHTAPASGAEEETRAAYAEAARDATAEISPAAGAPPAESDAAAQALARVIEPEDFVRTTERETEIRAETERETLLLAAAQDAERTPGESAPRAQDAPSPGTGLGARRDEPFSAALSHIARPAASFAYATERTDERFAEHRVESLTLARAETARAEADESEDAESAARAAAAESAAQSETVLREILDRVNAENKERLERVQELRMHTRETPAAAPRPDRQRIMRDALRAIENPEQVLMESLTQENAVPRTDQGAWEEALIYADEPSKRILELLQLLQKDPAAAAAAGVTLARGPEALMSEIAAVERARAEAAAPSGEMIRHIAPSEPVERLIERGAAASAALSPAQSAGGETPARRTDAPIVHRRTPAPDTEAPAQRREQRLVEERARRDETTEQTVRTNELRTQSEQITRDLVSGRTDDIAEMINTTLLRQLGTITDRVYGQLEKKLQSEKSRRGRI
jgi:hypothetical protein